ncbi:MAG: trimeric intracellular cation channel family protein, partial [Candidatus Cloacimonadota bacterium]
MEYLVVLDVLGIIAFAFTGYILAVKANLDIMGIFIISASNALGGGLVRDVIVGTTPFVFTNVYPLLVVLLTIIISIIFKLHLKNNLNNNYIF